MNLNILLFGVTRDIIGESELQLDLQGGTTVKALREQLSQTYPGLRDLTSLAIAVNSEYANDQTELQTRDEIALIPPVSGG